MQAWIKGFGKIEQITIRGKHVRLQDEYAQEIAGLYLDASNALMKGNISRKVVDITRKYEKPRRPTAAFSNFLINRRFGDWTEELLMESLNQVEGFRVARYGAGGRMLVTDPYFPELFDSYHDEVGRIGKRPDLLLFKEERAGEIGPLNDISEWDVEELEEICKSAELAIEVRSSKYYADVYEKEKGKEQSFTFKLEDLPILTHWAIIHNVPLFFAQIFFDCVHMISFSGILRIIGRTDTKYIKKYEKNQRKSTFYIPVSEGSRIGKIEGKPSWKADVEELEGGRVIPYVVPEGCKLNLNTKKFSREVLAGPTD